MQAGSSAGAEVHPYSTARGPARSRAPPRARRSTLRPDDRGDLRVGSSAGAEVHPSRRWPRPSPRWLLRGRGGPPHAADLAREDGVAPPRARRSTPAASSSTAPAPGSSAGAEVHPSILTRVVGASWRLRGRGGPPLHARRRRSRRRAPPRARRSTPGGGARDEHGGGSSAGAEVHPTAAPPRCRRGRLLRGRGGPPCSPSRRPVSIAAPPRARRSTLREARRQASLPGSSAGAEVHLPRRATSAVTAFGTAPPRARRSTRTGSILGSGVTGSSASAEVHPRWALGGLAARRLLRERGGPPKFITFQPIVLGAPPRARRSTLGARDPRLRGAGSSASAEVHPSRRRCSTPRRRLLRERGGPPVERHGIVHVAGAPPRARRSTPRRLLV